MHTGVSIMDDLLKIDEGFLDSIIVTQAKKGKGIFKGRTTLPSSTEIDALETFLSSDRLKKEKIKALTSKYQTESKVLKCDSKDIEFTVFKGSQSGSNQGFWVVNPLTGELGYAKFGKIADHSYSEKIASDLYRLTGAKTPEIDLIHEGRNTGVLSHYLPIEDIQPEHVKLLREDFGADCWLANWDALKPGNVGIHNGQVIRMDVGGSLRYRAQGLRKGADFGEDVQELTTFFGSSSLSKPYLKDMTRDELMKSLKKVTDVNDDDIKKIIKEQIDSTDECVGLGDGFNYYKRKRHYGIVGPRYLAETLITRKNYIAEFLKKCERTPQRVGETIEEYISRIASEMPKTQYKIPFERLNLSTRVGHKYPFNGLTIPKNMTEAEKNFYNELQKPLTMAETLTPSQKRIYDGAFRAYGASRGKTILHPDANEILTTDCMLHATKEVALDDILKKGVISGETPNIKGGTSASCTVSTLSADFWDVTSNMSIKDYFARTPQKCAEGELGFLYNRTAHASGGDITIVVNKIAVHKDIIEHSFTAMDKTSSSAKILRRDHNVLPWDYPTHRIVPFGTPANSIDRIIVRANMPNFDEVVQRTIGKIKASGLDIKLYDTEGRLIWKP